MVGAGGQLLERSLVDRMVYAAERLVFEGAPILDEPLMPGSRRRAPASSRASRPTPAALPAPHHRRAGQAAGCESSRANRLARGTRRRSPRTFVKEQAGRIVERTGIALAEAKRAVERQCGGVLLPPVILPFDADEMVGAPSVMF